jgi:hypothetical protein
MTIECRDLTLDQSVDRLSVSLEQRPVAVSSATGQLLGRYSFEVLRRTPDGVILRGRQSALPWPSPILVLGIDLDGTKTWAQLRGLLEGDGTAGAIEWVCRRSQ